MHYILFGTQIGKVQEKEEALKDGGGLCWAGGEGGMRRGGRAYPSTAPGHTCLKPQCFRSLARGYCCSIVLEHCRVRWLQAGVLNHSFLVEMGLPWWLRWEKECVQSNTGNPGLILGWKEPLLQGRWQPTPVFAWRIPQTEKPVGCRESDKMIEQLSTFTFPNIST